MAKKIVIFICCFIFSCCGQSLHKNTYVISGTYLEVISPHPKAASIVYQEFKRLNKIFNVYDSDSEIFRLNSSYNLEHKVSKEMIEILELSKELNKLTEGAFDASCGSLYSFWKDLIKKEKIDSFPSPEKIDKLRKSCSDEFIEVDHKKSTVLIKEKGLKIDLGAIAKGYMVDKAIQKLTGQGIDSALINAGGDIYCLGKKIDKLWTVGIKDPRQISKVVTDQQLLNEAVATSGDYEQFFE